MITTRLKNIVKSIPQKPGVYLFKDKAGRILYIGKAINLQKRVKSHFRKPKGNNSPLPPLSIRGGKNAIANIDWIETEDEDKAFLLENELIKKYNPRYNIQWRDDKSYFWVRFTDDEWPRVIVGHRPDFIKCQAAARPVSSGGNVNRQNSGLNRPTLNDTGFVADKRITNSFIGPFVSGGELRKTLRALRKILPYRTCKNLYEKPCLQWHLGLCPAHIDNLKIKNQNVKLQFKMQNYLNSLNVLLQFLRLYAGEPIRIEAYDISNIQGIYATGSMVVFEGAKPKKSDYRRFRIKTVQGANDVAMIKEVLRRRLNHPEWPHPDLILIDGGRAQLDAARLSASRYSPVAIIALAKQQEEIYTEYSTKPIRLLSLPEPIRLAFQAIRNEAHRFAIFYYRHLHGKQLRAHSRNIRKKIAPPAKKETQNGGFRKKRFYAPATPTRQKKLNY